MPPPPPNSPTIARPKSAGTWITFAVIALLVVAWNVQTFLLEGSHADPAPAAQVVAPPAPDGFPVANGPGASIEVAPPAPPQPPTMSDQPISAGRPTVIDACQSAIARSGMQLPADFRLLAAGGYRGRDLAFQIDQSGNRSSQIDVVVSSPDEPVVIMLGAYDPTVWKVSWTRGTKIVAVYAGGYHTQRVAGLPKDLPLLVSTYEDKSPCPYFYIAGEGMETLNPAARKVFNRPVDMVYLAGRDGTVFAGASGPLGGIESSNDTSVESFRDKDAPLAGQPGIEEAIRRGQLRRAGPGDVGLWAQALAQGGRSFDIPPISGQSGQQPMAVPSNVYVVMGEFTFPSGLYGAHSATFLVPPGVPRPKGNAGHSSVHMLR